MSGFGKAAFGRDLLDLGSLISQQVLCPLDSGLNQVISRGNVKKLMIISVKLTLFHAGHLA